MVIQNTIRMTEVDTTNANKRQKMNDEDAESENSFHITFDQTQSLRVLVDVISNILHRVDIQVMKDEKFEGIHIESIDPKHICLIVARLSCSVSKLADPCKFCVDTVTVNTCLKSVNSHYSLDIKNDDESSNVIMHAYETISNNYTTHFSVPTLVSEPENVKLSDLEYDYTIEIDLITLRTIVKNTIALRGNEVQFVVEEPQETTPYKYTILTIITDGNAKQKHQFHSITEKKGGGTCVIRTEEGGVEFPEHQKFDVKYSETFSAQYLNHFLKSMEKQVITMRLSKTKPLILNYPLGSDKSYICFVLAPRAE